MPHSIIAALNIYIILAIGYNLVSQILDDLKGKKLAPTDPTNGTLIIASIYLWFTLAPSHSIGVFLIGAATFIYLIGRFGILKHLMGFAPDIYHSRISWLAAMGINIFGLLVLLAYAVMVLRIS